MTGFSLAQGLLNLALSLPSPIVAVLEHVQAFGVQRPVAALPRTSFVSGHFDKAVVQREVVANRVLPALFVVMVKWKAVHDELIDPAQRRALVRRVLDCHGDERDVAVGRLLRRLLPGGGESQRGDNAPDFATVHIDEGGTG